MNTTSTIEIRDAIETAGTPTATKALNAGTIAAIGTGALLAIGLSASAGRFHPAGLPQAQAALIAASAFLYAGIGLDRGGIPLVANLLFGAALFGTALAASSGPSSGLAAAAFLAQAVWTGAMACRNRNQAMLWAWVAFNLILAAAA